MIERIPRVYILAKDRNGALYVGVTSDLTTRILQHRLGTFDGHTKRHKITRLVYLETFDTMAEAIAREKQLKRYRRDWKRNLIERENPHWDDLAVALGLIPQPDGSSGAVDPGPGPGDEEESRHSRSTSPASHTARSAATPDAMRSCAKSSRSVTDATGSAT